MATTRLFLEMGCKVICSDVSDNFLNELEKEISSHKPNYLILKSDVTKDLIVKILQNQQLIIGVS